METKFTHSSDVITIAKALRDAQYLGQISLHALDIISGESKANITGKSWVTICTITTDDNSYTGWAFCSYKDQFSKRVGRGISLERARHEIKKSKEGVSDPREKRKANNKKILNTIASFETGMLDDDFHAMRTSLLTLTGLTLQRQELVLFPKMEALKRKEKA